MHAPRRQRSCGDHRDCETKAETKHQGKPERKFLQLQADQQHGQRRRTRQEAARQSKEHNLPGGDRAIGEAFLYVAGMRPFMGVLVFTIGQIHRAMVMMMVGFAEFEVKGVGVAAVGECEAGVEFMRLG